LRRIAQKPAGAAASAAGDGSRSRGPPAPRTRGDQLGHVVSHSVYPDQWKANVAAALVDRRPVGKSSDGVGARREPLTFVGGDDDQGQMQGQMSRSNYSGGGVHQHQQPATDRQTSRGAFNYCNLPSTACIYLSP